MNTRRDYIVGLFMSLIWLAFLAFPTYYIATGMYSTTLKITGFILTTIFCIVYAIGCSYMVREPDKKEELRIFAATAIPLLGITFIILKLFNISGLSFFPYLFALAGMLLEFRYAISVVFTLSTIIELAGWWQNHLAEAHSFLLVSLGVFAMTSGTRYFDHAEREKRALSAREAVASERDRLARDVHDVLGHSLTILALKSELALRVLDSDPQRARSELEAISSLTRSAIAEVRATVSGLRMQLLTEELDNSLRVIRDSGLTVTVDGEPDAVDPRFRFVFAWVVREASTNILRHARASHVTIILRSGIVSVEDNGIGISNVPGNGLLGLRERVENAGGQLQIEPTHPGTRISALMDGEHA